MKTTLNILAFIILLLGVTLLTFCMWEVSRPGSLFLGLPISTDGISITDWSYGIIFLILGMLFLKINKN